MIVSIHLQENKCFCMKDTYYVTGSSRGGMVDTDEQIIAMAQPAIYINFFYNGFQLAPAPKQ